MTKCMDCGTEFEYARKIIYEDSPDEYVCPSCASDYIIDGAPCPNCGQWSDDGLCDVCEKKLKLKIVEFTDRLTTDELEKVAQLLDGVWFDDFVLACRQEVGGLKNV